MSAMATRTTGAFVLNLIESAQGSGLDRDMV
jgi:hypothetical protein